MSALNTHSKSQFCPETDLFVLEQLILPYIINYKFNFQFPDQSHRNRVMDSNSGQNGSSKGNTPQSKTSSKSRRRTYSTDADVSSEDEEKKKLLASSSKIELQSLIGNRSNSKFKTFN